jgi:hypothetical protein
MCDHGRVSDPPDDKREPSAEETEAPDFEQVLVRACVVAMWADGSMAAAERDALSQVIASVVRTQRDRDRLRQLALKDLNRHEVLKEVEALEPDQRLHLFDRCLAIVKSDRKLGRREQRFLSDLRRSCGIGYWAYQRLLYRLMPLHRKVLLVAVGVLAVVAAVWLRTVVQPPEPPAPAQQAAQPPQKAPPAETDVHPELLLPVPAGELDRLESEQLYEAVRRSVVTILVHVNGRRVAS